MFRLSTTITAPFCPSEVRGTVAVPPGLSLRKELLRFAGPGLLVSAGYMDPGNWVTNIEAGLRYGYALLFVVVLSSLAVMVLQCPPARLGTVTDMDLARASRNRYQPGTLRVQRLLAKLFIIACDLAEMLGCTLAFHLLLGVPVLWGVALTALGTLIALGLKGKNFRQLEAIMLGLILMIGLCYFVELVLIKSHWPSVVVGLMPSWQAVSRREPLYLATGILGATVMPHNLCPHSSIMQTRMTANTEAARCGTIGLSRLNTIVSLGLALLVNGTILILAVAALNAHGHQSVADIQDAYHLLEPIVGTALTGLLFGIALLVAGQNSASTGTIAGQILMEGFLDLRIPCWQRRLITRVLALIPAFIGVAMLGDHAIGKLPVISQVVLGLQLPLAMFPLIRMTGDRTLMGVFANSRFTLRLARSLFVVISVANVWLVWQILAG